MKIMFFLLGMLLICNSNVDADSFYINRNGIEISQSQYNNLLELGFVDDEIYNMSIEEFDYNKDIRGDVVTSDERYFKTIILYENEEALKNEDDNMIRDVFTYEVDDEEYNNSEKLSGNISFFANGVDTAPATVNYKKLTTTISYISSSNRYRFKNSLEWKKMPKVRSYDLSGIAIGTFNVTPVSGSQKSYYNYTLYNECSKKYIENQINYSSTNYWNRSSDGYYMSYPLKKDYTQTNNWNHASGEECPCVDEPAYTNGLTFTTDVIVKEMKHYMYYDVKKSSDSIKINALDAYGEYQHSVKSMSLGISLGFGWKSFGIDISVDYKEHYDNMEGTHAELTGINW